MSDQLKARVRTWWPLIVGHLAAWLLVTAAPVVDRLASLGVHVDQAEVAVLVGLVLAGVVYEVGRRLEVLSGGSWPAVIGRSVGRWLLSVGLHTGVPSYRPQHAVPERPGR